MRELRYSRSRSRAFTLVEMIIAIAIMAVVFSVALPSYQNSKKKALIATAKSDLVTISQRLEKYRAFNYAYPDSLDTLGGVPADPWGNDYQYLNLDNFDDKGKSEDKGKGKDKDKGGGGPKPKPRKDKNLKPLNTDFDLFSMGEDGDYNATLSAQASRDDVIRANDGAFIGLADDY